MRRASLREAALLVLATCAASACGHTSRTYVTPWFRVSTHHPPPTVIAESGGPKPTYESERRDRDGAWIRVADAGLALAVGGGERVLYLDSSGALLWIDQDGKSGRFPCPGDPFVPGSGKRRGQVLCAKLEAAEYSGEREGGAKPVPVAIRWMAPDGTALGPQQSFELPPNPYRSWSARAIVGFVDDAPVIAIENQRETSNDDFFPGKECTYFALEPFGPRSIGKPTLVDKHPPYERAEHSSCTDPEVIREALGRVALTAAITLS